MTDLIQQKKEFLTQQAKSCLKRMTSDIIELSRIAHDYHQEFGYQEYIAWINELGLYRKQGDRFLNVFDNYGSMDIMSINNIKPTVLYMLSAPSTPESARTEAIELAEAGETLTIKDTKELIEAHKRIDTLQKELESAKSQIPTEDIKSKIKDLEKKLEAERNKPAVTVTQTIEVEPDDYKEAIETKDRLIEEKCRLLNQIKKIKDSQAQEVASQVSQKLKALDDDFVLKNKQLESVQKRIDYLRESMKAMDKTAGDMVACKNACDKIRKHLFDISIDLRDLLEDHKITDSSAKEMRILCGELEQGAMAFRKYIDGFDDFIGIGEQA